MIVSSSGNKSCKILFCLGEIVFFSIIVVFSLAVTIYRNYAEANVQKNFIALRSCFVAREKPFFPFIRNSRQLKQFLLRETFFLTNSSFGLVETNFLSGRNSIVLFRALLKILKLESSSLFRRNLISARGNQFFG